MVVVGKAAFGVGGKEGAGAVGDEGHGLARAVHESWFFGEGDFDDRGGGSKAVGGGDRQGVQVVHRCEVAGEQQHRVGAVAANRVVVGRGAWARADAVGVVAGAANDADGAGGEGGDRDFNFIYDGDHDAAERDAGEVGEDGRLRGGFADDADVGDDADGGGKGRLRDFRVGGVLRVKGDGDRVGREGVFVRQAEGGDDAQFVVAQSAERELRRRVADEVNRGVAAERGCGGQG